MSLVAGTITVNPDGTYTGTGLAKAIADARLPVVEAQNAAYRAFLDTIPDQAGKTTALAWLADDEERHRRELAAIKPEAEALAAAIVAYITANATVSVSVTVPVAANALDAGVPTVPRSLSGTGTGTVS